MDKSIACLVTSCLLLSASALKLPHYIKKCSIKDPNFDTCALKSAKQSVPHLIRGDAEHKIPVLDPLIIEELRVNISSISASLRNGTLTGLKDIALQTVSFDFDKKIITVEATIPVVNLIGDYEVEGKLLGLPISGKGPWNSTSYNATTNYWTSYDLAKLDDGEVYLVLKDVKLTQDPAKVTVQLGNLFGGNEFLGNIMNNFINKYWRAVLNQVGEPSYEAMGLFALRISSEAAKTVPYKDIFDDLE